MRDIDDISGEAANAAEMKAAASGNPLMLMQVQLASDLKKLEAIYKNHQRQQYSLERRIEYLSTADERAAELTRKWRREIEVRDAGTTEKFRFEHDGKVYGEKEREALFNKLQLALLEATRGQSMGRSSVVEIGRYRGFEIKAKAGHERLVFSLRGADDVGYSPANLNYSAKDKFSLSGFVARLERFLGTFEKYCEDAEAARVKEHAEHAQAVAAFGKPFPQQELLEALRDDNRQVITELKKLEENSDYVSSWKPKSQAIKQHAAPPEQPKQEEPQRCLSPDAKKWQIEAAAIEPDWDRYNRTAYFLVDKEGKALWRDDGSPLVFHTEQEAKDALAAAFRVQGRVQEAQPPQQPRRVAEFAMSM